MSSTVAQRLEQTVFYLDESIYSRALVEGMRAAGANVRHAGGAFPFGTADEVWLTGSGRAGWIVLMRDKRVRYRPLEYLALREAASVPLCSRVAPSPRAKPQWRWFVC